MATIRTAIVQSNFANGVVSPRLKWTTNEEIYRSSATELTNCEVGNYGEVSRRQGVCVGGAFLGERVCGFTVRDLDTGTAERLVMGVFADGTFAVYRSKDVLLNTATPLLQESDMQNTMLFYPRERTVFEDREENPSVSKTKTATLINEYTGLYEWQYSVAGESGYEIVTTTGTLPMVRNTALTVVGRLRHANYGGEEYFCGHGQAPFKISLQGGVFSIGILKYEVPPFNDMVVGGEDTFYFKKVFDSANLGYGIVQLPEELFISRFDSLKLVNYNTQCLTRKKLHYKATGTAEAGNRAGWTSDILPAFGNVTLRAEGSYWAGTLVLYERMKLEDGTTQDVELGQIAAGGLASTMNLSASITRLDSRVFVKLTEFYDAVEYMKMNGGSVPNDEYKDLGVTVVLQVSGSQEVLCVPFSEDVPEEIVEKYPEPKEGYKTLVFRCDTEILCNTTLSPSDEGYEEAIGSFSTNSFATSIIRSSLMDFPHTICFYQDRLVFGGTDANPKKICMSKTGYPLNFQYGTNDDDAVSTVVSGSDLEEIYWLCPRDALLVGTSRREYSLRGSNTAAITPTSIKVSKPSGDSSYTSADIECRNLESGVVCVRGNKTELLSYNYSSDTYTYQPHVLNPFNKELFEAEGGIADFVVSARPEAEVWVLFNSGKLAHVRMSESVKNGWTFIDFSAVASSIGARATGLFTNNEDDRDCVGIVFYTSGYAAAGYLYSDAQAYASADADLVGASLADAGAADYPYADFYAPLKKSFAFETSIAMNPWYTAEGDAWGKRVVPTKTCLCLCAAREFEASFDDGKTFGEENVVFRPSDGNRRELSYTECELMTQGRWNNCAALRVRTTDNHAFILSVVRTRLSVGE